MRKVILRTMRERMLPALGAFCTALLVVSIASLGAAPPAAAAPKKSTGGTVTMATTEGEKFSYMFPFMSNEYLYGPDIHDFQFLMYRPLYWWNGSPYKLTLSRSLADYPKFENHDKTVVVPLKRGWKYSDGQTVSPESVAFFMGLLLTEHDTFWSYIPGDFPDNLASTSYDDAEYTVTFHLKESVNPTWFLENQLLMITPFPSAWDLSGPGKKSDCESETVKVEKADCPAVYKYLTSQSKDTTTYATNPLWQVVDGPFHLTSYTSGGTSVTLEPNKSYSGSPKARISKLVFDVPTSTAAEYGLLQSGAVTIGYVPFTSAPIKAISASKPPSNPVPGDNFVPVAPIWAYNDVFWNYNNPKIGPLIHQLYFRQAMESLVDQKADIETALRGYGFYDVGPNPPAPSVTQPGNKALDTLDNYLVKTAALLWMPVPDNVLYEVSPHLEGFTESPILTFQPETLYVVK